MEYKFQNLETVVMYYLNVELSDKVILYEILEDTKFEIKRNITYNNNEYEFYEKGDAKVETYFGITDIALNEEVSYYEYKNKEYKTKNNDIYNKDYRHKIFVIKETKLHDLINKEEYTVNSIHSMIAPKENVEGYAKISSISYDDLVESFELNNKKM